MAVMSELSDAHQVLLDRRLAELDVAKDQVVECRVSLWETARRIASEGGTYKAQAAFRGVSPAYVSQEQARLRALQDVS